MTNTNRGITVPLLDLAPQYAVIQEEITEAIQAVIGSQRFILGPKVEELEENLAQYCHCKFGVGVSSGTDALLLALMTLGIGPGDAVITTPYTFFATAGSIARLGARPLLCDIDPATHNISPACVDSLIAEKCTMRDGVLVDVETGRTVKAMLPVHLYGQTADMTQLLELAKKYRLRVVEDAAQAIGAEYHNGRRAGGMGDIGCFSFFPSKNLGACGDGGLCTTNDPELDQRMRVLRVHGAKPKYHHGLIGGNFRLDALQAAVLLVKMKYLDGWIESRQQNAAYYDAAFRQAGVLPHVAPPVVRPGYRHVFNQYVIRAERRDDLRTFLTAQGIATEIYYPIPLHLQECFAHLGHRPESLPQSENAAGETLALPIYPELTNEQQQWVVGAIAEFYGL
jgi:dTDP-4-amino-4,6-dideoxygalactose transaminase